MEKIIIYNKEKICKKKERMLCPTDDNIPDNM
jgi:hypothetical protein